MGLVSQFQLAVCIHASAGAFLYNSLRKGTVSGLSGQTTIAMAVCAFFIVMIKLWWKVYNWLHDRPTRIDKAWEFQICGYLMETFFLLASFYMLKKNSMKPKANTDGDEHEDDFGRAPVRSLWYMIPGQTKAPPAYLHWALIYVGAILISFCTALASVKFNIFSLWDWGYARPTAMMAIFDNSLRALGLLPQLHLSRKVGRVCPSLAVWIAMVGAVDLIELVDDGFAWTDLCYVSGDLIALALVSDFMYLFVKSRLQGQQVVEIPMSCQV